MFGYLSIELASDKKLHVEDSHLQARLVSLDATEVHKNSFIAGHYQKK